MDKDMKNSELSEDGNEFEIPELPFAVNDEASAPVATEAEAGAKGEKKPAQRKKRTPKPTEGENSAPEAEANAESEPEKKPVQRKKRTPKPTEGENGALEAEANAESEPEKKPVQRKKRTPKPTEGENSAPEAEATTAEGEKKPTQRKKRTPKPTEGENGAPEAEANAEGGVTLAAEGEARSVAQEAAPIEEHAELERSPERENDAKHVTEELGEVIYAPEDHPEFDNGDASDEAEKFETDEYGRRLLPEGFIPDDAFSVPQAAAPDGSVIIDLLGDPVVDEPSPTPADEPIAQEAGILEETEQPEPIPQEEKYDPERPRHIDVIFDFVELLVFTLVGVLVITSFFLRHAVVSGPSMENTLRGGDVLLISDLFYTPATGDIIVFDDPTAYSKPLVKRVIAVGGQRVTVKAGGIYVDYVGEDDRDPTKPIYEPYVYTDGDYYEYSLSPCEEIEQLESFGKNSEAYWFIVPEGELFVLGDHRSNSTDSRDLGTIREDSVLGKAIMRIYPFDRIYFISQEDGN